MRICRGSSVLIVTCLLLSSSAAQERSVTQLSPAARGLNPVPRTSVHPHTSNKRQANANPAPAQESELVKRMRQLAKLRDQPTTGSGSADTNTKTPTVRPASHQTFSTAAPQQPVDTSEAAFLDLTQPATVEGEISTSEPTNSDMFIQFGVWTVIILCCCGLTVLSIRLWQRRNGILPAANSTSRVLETVALGPRRSISLVQLGDVRAVVGCDSTGVTSIVLAPESFESSLAETNLQHMEYTRN